jgi:phage/plasmid-like protein (TIGR03299 family)
MAHEVETMFSVGRVPWHGLGHVIENAPTIAEGIRLAGLDWQVRTEPVQSESGLACPAQAVIRSTDNTVLGVVGPDYQPLQNADAFDWFEPFVSSEMVRLETAGSLRNGQRVFILARLNIDAADVVPGDAVTPYLLLSNGHDGKLAVRVGFTPIRVVCQNTLRLAHGHNASKLIRVIHCAGVKRTLDELRGILDLLKGDFEATIEQYRYLASRPLNLTDFRKYVKVVFNPEAQLSDGGHERIETRDILANRIVPLFETGRGNDQPGAAGTWWAGYNAVSEYLTHEKGTDQGVRLDSLWHGQGAASNKRALDVAVEMATA